jgi:hypothetical protein
MSTIPASLRRLVTQRAGERSTSGALRQSYHAPYVLRGCYSTVTDFARFLG